jgi:hypothetical protein
MRAYTGLLSRVAIIAATAAGVSAASAEVSKVAYPAIKVEVAEAFKPDAAFETMRKAFSAAAHTKDAKAIFALVAPGFVWTANGALASDFDPGRDPLHNFKVLFGFREFGKDADGAVEGGPFWDALASFADDGTYYKTGQASGLVCGPAAATVTDDDAFAQAHDKIDTADEAAAWFFVTGSTPVMKSPGDKGAPIATVNAQALPVLNTFPAAAEGQAAPAPTHYEVLLPTGKSGWIAAAAARPMVSNRLCYAMTPSGHWAIALYDDAGDSEAAGEQ